MTTKLDAAAAADEILARERRSILSTRYAGARRLPSWARVPELELLEPRHREVILRQAEREVQRRLSFQLCGAAWLVSLGGVLYLASSFGSAASFMLVLAPALGIYAIRARFVRAEVRRILGDGKDISCTARGEA